MKTFHLNKEKFGLFKTSRSQHPVAIVGSAPVVSYGSNRGAPDLFLI